MGLREKLRYVQNARRELQTLAYDAFVVNVHQQNTKPLSNVPLGSDNLQTIAHFSYHLENYDYGGLELLTLHVEPFKWWEPTITHTALDTMTGTTISGG
jgi:hypothetical protein